MRRAVRAGILRRRTLAALAATAFAVWAPGGAATAASAGSATRVGANYALGVPARPSSTNPLSALRGTDIPAFASDPANPQHIVEVDENFITNQCEYHVSYDGGTSWTAGGNLTTPPDFSQPPCHTFDSGGYAHFDQSVVWGSGQNVYVTFASHRGLQERPETHVIQGEGDSIMVAHSTDGGRTFATSTVAIQGGPGPQPYVIRPGIAVKPSTSGGPDTLYVVGWQVIVTSGGASSGGGLRAELAVHSTDGGATWSANSLVSAPNDLIRELTQPVVLPNGTVCTGYRDRNAAPALNHIVVSCSKDGGVTWTQSAAGLAAAAGVSSGGGYPRLAVDSKSGTLYLVYQGAISTGTVIYEQYSTDGGQTWSNQIQVNHDPTGNGVAHDSPGVFVAPNGRVDVVWQDLRNSYPNTASNKSSGFADVFLASSTDNGQSFGPNVRITDRSIDMDAGLIGRIGTYIWYGPAMAELGNNTALVGFGDPRGGNVNNQTQDIYLAKVTFNASGAIPSSSLPVTSAADLSVNLAGLAYPGGYEEIGGTTRSAIVVVNQTDTDAALAGAVLARAVDGPLLLSPPDGLTKALRQEVGSFHPSAAIIIGGTNALSTKVASDLKSAGVTGAVTRITGADPASEAAAVATQVEAGGPQAITSSASPYVPLAVIVNPASSSAAEGVALAAAKRYPVLFSGSTSVPAATTSELSSLGITSVLVVGSTSDISSSAQGQLPGATRLATTADVVNYAVTHGLPDNVAYVTDSGVGVDGAIVAAAVARLGGVVVANSGASASSATNLLAQVGVTSSVSRVVVAHSTSVASIPWVLIIVFIALGVIGLVLLVLQRSRRATAVTGAAGAGTSGRTPEPEPAA